MSSSSSSQEQKNGSRALPKLVVFDLDATLWTPELYEISGRPFRKVEVGKKGQRHHRIVDRSGYAIDLFPEARRVLEELATDDKWEGSKFALASRTDCVQDAHELMQHIQITSTLKMADLFHYKQIFPGSKRTHFANLHKESGIAYREMIFFDDWDLNCRDVAKYGVSCVHVPSGLNLNRWKRALEMYEQERGTTLR